MSDDLTSMDTAPGEPKHTTSFQSATYWETRYQYGLNSGAGSYGMHAQFKAAFLNAFVDAHTVTSVIDWGCGDGNQLSLLDVPRYLGMDVSAKAVELSRTVAAGDNTKSFIAYNSLHMHDPARFVHADLALSMEVIFHLVEDDVYDRYMHHLFGSADRFVVVYCSNTEEPADGHMHSRRFSDWVDAHAPEWRLVCFLDGPDHHLLVHSGFFCYARIDSVDIASATAISAELARRANTTPAAIVAPTAQTPTGGGAAAPGRAAQASGSSTSAQGGPLKVLLGTMEIANQVNLMSRSLSRLGVETFSVNYYPSYLKYPSDVELDLFTGRTADEAGQVSRTIAAETVGKFDIYHFHFGSTLALDGTDLQAIRDSGGVPIMQHHGSDVRNLEVARRFSPYVLTKDTNEDARRQRLKYFCRHIDDVIVWDFELYQYVKDHYRRVHFLRHALDLQEPAFRLDSEATSQVNTGRLRVAHAPTHRGVKGTEHVLAAIDGLRNPDAVELVLVEGVDHETALGLYSSADIVIDQLLIGAHGVLSLEAMALGRPVICYISDLMRANYPSDLPIINANPDNLTAVLQSLIDDRDGLPDIGSAGRRYVEKYHDLDVVGPELLRIYRSCLPM